MKRVLCILFIFYGSLIIGQNQSNLDSLLARLPLENNDTLKVDLLNSIAWKHRNCFPNTFSIYWPRDIVSGDFYWCHNIGNIFLLAVADRTGHGVLGSLLSMLGQNMLNQIVVENGIYDPGEVLPELNRRIIANLKRQSGADLNEGMDISFVKFDSDKQELSFAGAMNSMVCINNEELIEITADRSSIGGFTPIDFKFETKNVPTDKESTYYLFTDGYADQFGGENGKKMKISKFKTLLTIIVNKPFESQQQEIEKYFKEWQGNHIQVDDVCIIGFQV